uniref:Regulator of telomere elongation helicase 1 n=1 Tax=Sparus aurata TaxID=8175 RepID=A0A671VP82_SPAAU
MSSLTLNGVTVNFPFTPYDCQKDYMSKVIECLQTKSNGVLESPTGTGKTLCLLCSTLAWREHFKDTISARKIAERLGSEEMFPNTPLSSWGTAATDAYYTDVPKIIYASRTHSQLAQVINELKNTSYRPKVCVLGSREQLCINQEVMRQESNHIKVHMCRSKVSTRSCVFYNNYEEKSTDKDLVNSILDVEDLVKFGNKQRACPYYLSRSLKQQADIIFMPYNYLLDPKSRRAHNIELNGAVIIFDEAHNVEKTCEESTSFDLTPYDIASAIDAVNRLLVEQAKDVSCGDSVSGDFNVDSLNSGQNEILLNLEAAIDSYDVPSDKGITKPGRYVRVWCSMYSVLLLSVTNATTSYMDLHQGRFWGGPTGASAPVTLSLDPPVAPLTGSNILSYWCFSPGFSMQDLVSQGVRCIILTSGTLSPLSSFTSEMRIEFKVSLENSHVIDRDQIFVSVIDRGPDGVHLSSAFDRRFVPENMASLGNTVANLSRVVPHGLLVFFPSFPLMEKTLEFWRAKGHADRIETVKPIFVEPKGKGTFTEVMDGYYSKVNDPASKGGTFFAVCRGKASEGLDFANTFGRGVIITGLPFPPRMDPRVILKMQFLDEMIRKNTSKLKYLSGQQWYKQQAFRAVNQAIGRVIRHREDYGAIFLCDQRFKNSDARAQLPSWVRPYVRLYDGFGNVVRDVSQFFRVAQKMVGSILMINCSMNHCPAVITKKQTVLCRQKPPNIGPDCTTMRQGTFFCMTVSYSFNYSIVLCLFKANRLSTLSLQHDKRMDDEMRGGKRKIRLVQEQVHENKDSRAKTFLAEMKKSLSQVTFECIVQALQTYKKSDNLDALLTKTTVLSEDANTHSLLRGLYQFVRAHHKQRFDEKCQELTGQGCGYKPDHSLTKDKKTALKLGTSNCTQLNTQQLNKGGPHLNQQGLGGPQTGRTTVLSCYSGSAPKSEVHAAFLADVKKALGAEKSAQLFQAIYSYKKTDNYENLVTTVVSLFTERDEDFNLLVRFGVFIRPHHKKQYKDMLDSLVGQSDSAADVPALSEDLQRHGKDNAMHIPSSPILKTQSKISNFFSSSQRK